MVTWLWDHWGAVCSVMGAATCSVLLTGVYGCDPRMPIPVEAVAEVAKSRFVVDSTSEVSTYCDVLVLRDVESDLCYAVFICDSPLYNAGRASALLDNDADCGDP